MFVRSIMEAKGRFVATVTPTASLSDAVALAASEVLSNAVLHARTSIEVVFDLGEQLIVSVHDGTPPWTSTGP